MDTSRCIYLKLLVTLAILLVPAVWVSCSVAEHRETLSFWFDGVPTLEEEEAARVKQLQGEFYGPLTASQEAALASKRARLKATGSRHKPVADKQCHECHNMPPKKETGWSANLPTLLFSKEELCLKCHEPAQGTYTHGPSASGNCAVCHLSHTSRYPHLLKESPMQGLCQSCHDPADLLEPEKHAEYEEFDCIDCHNPHASEQEYLLLEDYPRASSLSD